MLIEYRGKRPKVAASAFIAPTAVLIGDVEVGEDSSVWFGTVLRGDNGAIRIGARSSVQDNSVMHVSEDSVTSVGDDCTIGHCAVLEDCRIENGALVGSNAVVLNGAVVGAQALIAAGAVVGANVTIPPRMLAAGQPATVKRELNATGMHWVEHAPVEYVHLTKTYREAGIDDLTP